MPKGELFLDDAPCFFFFLGPATSGLTQRRGSLLFCCSFLVHPLSPPPSTSLVPCTCWHWTSFLRGGGEDSGEEGQDIPSRGGLFFGWRRRKKGLNGAKVLKWIEREDLELSESWSHLFNLRWVVWGRSLSLTASWHWHFLLGLSTLYCTRCTRNKEASLSLSHSQL